MPRRQQGAVLAPPMMTHDPLANDALDMGLSYTDVLRQAGAYRDPHKGIYGAVGPAERARLSAEDRRFALASTLHDPLAQATASAGVSCKRLDAIRATSCTSLMGCATVRAD